jgi:hypothetical protein|tara:strand:+ start:6562 stop:6702 length:141 start_codon:yes stop_codon:yes gene_type:complete
MGRKKKYKGVATRVFGIGNKRYEKYDLFETTDKEVYDNLINIKRIK